jgi:membrane fusion protein (multidrug efflux system)
MEIIPKVAPAQFRGRRILPAALVALAILVTAGAAYTYWHYTTVYPSTDNAYVRASVVQIAPAVSGRVSDVMVKSFAHVKAGDELLRIDEPRFEAALKMAEARLRSAGSQKDVEARAAVEQARADLENATVKSPVDGIVGNITIRPGSMARAGATLLPIIDSSTWWVDANFKETDLGRIREGQKATVKLDIYPRHEFAGEVEAVGAASTSAFSLLPNENATGNWIKLTQRFPVRISLSLKPGDPAMRFGASAAVSVDTTDQGSR